MNYQLQQEIHELLSRSLEGVISETQMNRLNAIINEDVAVRQYCNDFYFLAASLRRPELHANPVVSTECSESEQMLRDLEKLARYETMAEVVDIPRETPKQELIQKVEREKIGYKFSRGSLVSIITSFAAILLIALFVRFAPSAKGVKVAVLSDSINAKWEDANGKMEKGVPLITSYEYLFLREGYAELLFDNNARVLIEGPAGFQILTEDQIKLRYGKLYATVPQEAIGFTVTTQTAKVIDLGTEFGVQADVSGDTSLHVIQGKTTLVAGERYNKSIMEVGKGAAKKVSGVTQTVSDVICDDRLFVRAINSAHGLVWRGQTELNLADVVGGGNGFNTGRLNQGVDPASENFRVFTQGTEVLIGSVAFKRFEPHAYIDGIFTPNGESGPVQVSSEGHLFAECPVTNGNYWVGIFNGAWHEGGFFQVPRHHLRLGGKEYGTVSAPAIDMHANQGITFDLHAIRAGIRGFRIVRFTAKAGVSESLLDYPAQLSSSGKRVLPKASFYVLVDGRPSCQATDRSPGDGAMEMQVELSETDRFLTLITTQGSDGTNTYDWTLFAEPFLQLERR